MDWPVFLLGPGLGPVQARARARAWSAPGPRRGGPGPGTNYIPEAPHVCRVVWRGEAPTCRDFWQLRSHIISSAYRGPYFGQN